MPIIDSKHDFKFCEILIRSKGMVELMLLTCESIPDIPVLLDIIDIKMPALKILYVMDEKPSCRQHDQSSLEPHCY